MHRVLVVDDEPKLARLFARVLGKHGYLVDCVTCAANARALLNVRRYDVFLCDLNINGERGLDLIVEMRPRLTLADTQVVVISGQDHMRSTCDEAGIEFFLSKPVGTHELAHFVNRLVAGRRLPQDAAAMQ